MVEKNISLGVIGGIGLGLLLGSEFSGTYITIAGAVLILVFLALMVWYRKK